MGDTVPEPDWVLEVRQWLQDRDNSHAAAVSAADNAALRERVKVLEDALADLLFGRLHVPLDRRKLWRLWCYDGRDAHSDAGPGHEG